MKLSDKVMIFGGGLTVIYLGYSLIKRKITARHLDNYNMCCMKISEACSKSGEKIGKVEGLLHL